MASDKKNDNIAKTLKNWITIISYVSFVINILLANSILTIFTVSFMYYASAGLTFYEIEPKSEGASERRSFVINYSIASSAIFLIILVIMSSMNQLEYWIFFFAKSYSFTSIMIPICSLKDDGEYESEETKKTRKKVKDKLQQNKKEKIFKVRNKKVINNKQVKKYVLKDKKI